MTGTAILPTTFRLSGLYLSGIPLAHPPALDSPKFAIRQSGLADAGSVAHLRRWLVWLGIDYR
jgi:hypothetical protein